MVTTELGACEWFVWDLRRSNLIDRGQLDQIIGEFLAKSPRAEPPQLAEYLVGKNILTGFQAERLLQGKTQGFVLGPFTLMDALGSGSMGTVYKAHNKNDNKWYAVKVLPRRSMWNVRIARRKVRAFESIKHQSVVPFVDVGTAGGMHYLAWPFAEGESLEKMVQAQTKLSVRLACHIAMQIAEGLDAAHHNDLFHGLIKPSNILVGPEKQTYILDFGIGCLLAETEGESLVDTMSTANSVTSGLDCASPESIMDPTNLTPAGDQYSLGCTLYFMLTGQYPYPDGSAAEKMMAHQFKEPTPVQELNPEVPPAVAAVIARLMKKAPDQRYGSTSEVVDALRPFVGSGELSKFMNRPEIKKGSNRIVAADRKSGIASANNDLPQSGIRSATSVTAPTPRPTALGQLPTRGSLRSAAAPVQGPATQEPARVEPAQPALVAEKPMPASVDEKAKISWEEKVGPIGITISAIAACALVYFALIWLKIF